MFSLKLFIDILPVQENEDTHIKVRVLLSAPVPLADYSFFRVNTQDTVQT